MNARSVIHLREQPDRTYCGHHFAPEPSSVAPIRGYPKLISWDEWLKLVHPLPYRLCKRCRRAHARRCP